MPPVPHRQAPLISYVPPPLTTRKDTSVGVVPLTEYPPILSTLAMDLMHPDKDITHIS